MAGPFGEPIEPELSGAGRIFTIDSDELVNEQAPWFADASHDVVVMLMPVARELVARSGAYLAAGIIFSQATNDLLDLLSDAARGSGRSATRTARALIEHAINMADVVSSDEMAQRYVDHLQLVHILQESASIGVELLEGNDRRTHRRRLSRAANNVRRSVQDAKEKYGQSFERSWTPQRLYDRAHNHGLTDLYEFYRVASLVMHGAAGGNLGTTRTIERQTVHRIGPAFELCPLALLMGLRAFRELLDHAAPCRPDLDMDPCRAAIDTLISRWVDYRRVIIKSDKGIWPATPPESPQAVLAFTRQGLRRWYWHDPLMGIMIEADPPTLPAVAEEGINRVVSRVLVDPDMHFAVEDRWAAIGWGDTVPISPRSGGRVIPESALRLKPLPPQDWLGE